MKDLRQTVATAPNYVDVLFFYQGSVEDGEDFFQRFWPEARAVSDMPKNFYTAFGLERAGIRQIFGPEVVACGIRAAQNGSFAGKPLGDTRMMPGAFLVQGNRVLWQHSYRHIADHPDFARLHEVTIHLGQKGVSV